MNTNELNCQLCGQPKTKQLILCCLHTICTQCLLDNVINQTQIYNQTSVQTNSIQCCKCGIQTWFNNDMSQKYKDLQTLLQQNTMFVQNSPFPYQRQQFDMFQEQIMIQDLNQQNQQLKKKLEEQQQVIDQNDMELYGQTNISRVENDHLNISNTSYTQKYMRERKKSPLKESCLQYKQQQMYCQDLFIDDVELINKLGKLTSDMGFCQAHKLVKELFCDVCKQTVCMDCHLQQKHQHSKLKTVKTHKREMAESSRKIGLEGKEQHSWLEKNIQEQIQQVQGLQLVEQQDIQLLNTSIEQIIKAIRYKEVLIKQNIKKYYQSKSQAQQQVLVNLQSLLQIQKEYSVMSKNIIRELESNEYSDKLAIEYSNLEAFNRFTKQIQYQIPKMNKQVKLNIEEVIEAINRMNWNHKEFMVTNRTGLTKKKKTSANVSFDKTQPQNKSRSKSKSKKKNNVSMDRRR